MADSPVDPIVSIESLPPERRDEIIRFRNMLMPVVHLALDEGIRASSIVNMMVAEAARIVAVSAKDREVAISIVERSFRPMVESFYLERQEVQGHG